jgi:L-amino acid N-acyltransferase YncA
MILEIYKKRIDTKNVTFEIKVPLWLDWDLKHLSYPRYMLEQAGKF